MAEVVKIDPIDFELQTYEVQDTSLISQFDINTSLTGSSYIEFYVYDLNNNLLEENLNYRQYKVENDGQSSLNNNISQFNISPDQDILDLEFTQGEYITYYNFLTKRIGEPFINLFISEITLLICSSSRLCASLLELT